MVGIETFLLVALLELVEPAEEGEPDRTPSVTGLERHFPFAPQVHPTAEAALRCDEHYLLLRCADRSRVSRIAVALHKPTESKQ